MFDLPDCQYCRKDQRLHDLMIEIAPMSASTLYLFKEQSHRGRCVVAYNGHINELFELPDAELIRFTQDVARAARAIKTAVNAKKINYGAYSDKLPHLHMHLVPKPLGLIGRCRSARGRGNGADCSGRTHGAKSLVPIRYSSKHGKTSVESASEK